MLRVATMKWPEYEAIRIGNSIVVMDMGIRLDWVVRFTQDRDCGNDALQRPDQHGGHSRRQHHGETSTGTVRAIACTHGHVDYIGAISKLAHKYHAPIIASPFTADLINQEIKSGEVSSA